MVGGEVRYLSVCSGIEAATQAWHPLGWEPVAFSEIEKFPSAVLAHHYPNTPNLGDMTKFRGWDDEQIDLLVGGTPCQSFSVAGLRAGLGDPRGNLALTFAAICERYNPRWVVWENVPGVLSADKGRAFGSILGALAELGYGWAYRVLDAQFVRTRRYPGAVPQRRRRVFVVAHLGDWRRAAAVLFDPESLSGNPPPGGETGEGVAVSPTIRAGGNRTGGDRPPGTDVDTCDSLIPEVANPLTHRMHKGINTTLDGGQTPLAVAPALTAANNPSRSPQSSEVTQQVEAVHLASMAVRRLTPVECERLQGFPDNFTRIPWRNKPAEQCPDGPRYKALGNSMAVNCMEWIGQRIAAADAV